MVVDLFSSPVPWERKVGVRPSADCFRLWPSLFLVDSKITVFVMLQRRVQFKLVVSYPHYVYPSIRKVTKGISGM